MTIYKIQLEKNNRVFDKNIYIDKKNKNPEAELKTFLKSYEKEGYKIIKDGLKDGKDNILDKAKKEVKDRILKRHNTLKATEKEVIESKVVELKPKKKKGKKK